MWPSILVRTCFGLDLPGALPKSLEPPGPLAAAARWHTRGLHPGQDAGWAPRRRTGLRYLCCYWGNGSLDFLTFRLKSMFFFPY